MEQQSNIKKKDILMIGDRLDTDILLGINATIDTLLVYTGVTSKEEVIIHLFNLHIF